ncbi:prolipoprotein diacylglyceryl transferase [Treponema phagedenis]|uniref:Phosphatidylglycerol--prolipoprotein diacylglyceryl transferase n=1 Tax=Treponema phagedenis TaxID=162 RepID=A0A0B7GR49_TREPH|nr:prolipoprotein diacylglyceryl transferase [Treponema phagedenis]EFW37776.1 prolipoprotein diacylglyceryl transferase [Treponema phagedenis F0421]NVP24631.1 prolipoprotein diacylglyceryl transferase [Treponema phagedenis]QEJ94610.1 prolipoprotein diacylglyceryl transferase [Treponema phagedenis]QEJ97617.1 prolipoprotein diacylglyceryl transferase [Treponema phagedenis]QEK00585.1 prolipoprotein diacylglyceryl transferase [Treponema phagedenis]
MLLAIQYPSWIHPEIIPGFPVRWYGLMYIVAFAIAYFLFSYQVKHGELNKAIQSEVKITDDDVVSFFTWGIIGLLLGARIFSTIIYEPGSRYLFKPWLIFWPFSEDWEWVGLQGMSYHGGFIGGFLGALFWTIKHKQPFLAWADSLAISIPLGYTFGRLGNFFNGELYGRITDSPIGMIFPHVPLNDCFPASEAWVQEFAARVGIPVVEGAQFVNLPRHPSQLYEAFFEGIVLWLFLWLLRKKKPFNGFLTCLYTIGYGTVRFFIEYFRQPDADLGYRFSPTNSGNIYLYESWKNISTGQVLCFIMIAGGLAAMAVLWFFQKKKNAGVQKQPLKDSSNRQ